MLHDGVRVVLREAQVADKRRNRTSAPATRVVALTSLPVTRTYQAQLPSPNARGERKLKECSITGRTCLGNVYRDFSTGNATAVSSGVTGISEQTSMAGDVLISDSDKRAKMGKNRTDLLRGTLDLLILKALTLEPLHGVGVSRRITQITCGAFRVSFGSLFPSLHRMEEKGWVEIEWRASENNRRAKYYRLTSSGRAQLKAEERDWSQVVQIMTAAVEST